MSQQELEYGDREVMGMVNGHSHPVAAANAEKIAATARKPAVHTADVGHSTDAGDTEAVELRRQILWSTIQILSCVLAALLFVAAMIDPGVAVRLANFGVLICGMAAAVKFDRAVQSWRKRGCRQ